MNPDLFDRFKKAFGKNFVLNIAFLIYVYYVARTWHEVCVSKGYFWAIPNQVLVIGGAMLSAIAGVSGVDKVSSSVSDLLSKKDKNA